MHVLLVHSDNRQFERERFGAAWLAAGGLAGELVPHTPAMAAAPLPEEDTVAGLLLTGGPDVEPERYGAESLAGVALHVQPERDALDLALLELAAGRGWPVLAVCYGCQILNVFHGGTLIQDLERAGKPGHAVAEPKDHLAHGVARMARVREPAALPAEMLVNSRHHQAIDGVGAGLEVIALAPDGVVEAVQARSGDRLVLGVQWHPENLRQAEHLAIFAGFRSACVAFSPHGRVSPDPEPRAPSPCL